MSIGIEIRKVKPSEYVEIGEIMVSVYQDLKGFPDEQSAPEYYNSLRNVSDLLKKDGVEIYVCVDELDTLMGGVVYMSHLNHYGQTEAMTSIKRAGAFRLLAVENKYRGMGVGKMLVRHCINKSKSENHERLIIHSTKAMQVARKMYKKMGFIRLSEIDFEMSGITVFGFSLTH